MVLPQFKSKNLSRVPRKQAINCFFFIVIIILLFINLFSPNLNMLKNMQHINITIGKLEDISYAGSRHSTNRQYVIHTAECSYYFEFPTFSDEHIRFNNIESEILNGEINSVSITVTTKQTFLDKIHNRYRILKLDIDGTEYLSISTSKKLLLWEYIGGWIGFLLIGLIATLYIVITVIGYDILVFRPIKRKKDR